MMRTLTSRIIARLALSAVAASAGACSNGIGEGMAAGDGTVTGSGDGTATGAGSGDGSANGSGNGTGAPGAAGTGAGTVAPDVTILPEECAAPRPGSAPLRRLSNAEYQNTVADLLGDETLAASVTRNFPRETTSLGFRNAASALTVSALIADQYVRAARALAPTAAANPEWNTCDEAEPASECARSFVESLGPLVYRRPLLDSEIQSYSDLYATVMSETNDFREALEWIAAGMLSSPNFLFRVELSAPPAGDTARPAAYEMANRLSYLLWQSMPDEELFLAAAAGELETEEGIDAQVRRMAGDPRALRVYEFFEQWLDLDEAVALSRSETSYPDFNPELPELLRAESRAFVTDLLRTNGTLSNLLAADYTFANRTLATHYGLATLPEGPAFERVPVEGRAGILTQGSLLVHDRPGRTSIVRRGLKLRTDFLCQIVPAPPDNVDTNLPELDGTLSQKERLAQHRENPDCVGCHALMDPLGEIFEGYDALGRVRQVDEGGLPVEPGGTVTATQTLDGAYESPRELALAMAESEEVRACFSLQAFRFFYGRDATPEDACTRAQLAQSFARNEYRLIDLIIGLTLSDQFRFRAGETP